MAGAGSVERGGLPLCPWVRASWGFPHPPLYPVPSRSSPAWLMVRAGNIKSRLHDRSFYSIFLSFSLSFFLHFYLFFSLPLSFTTTRYFRTWISKDRRCNFEMVNTNLTKNWSNNCIVEIYLIIMAEKISSHQMLLVQIKYR